METNVKYIGLDVHKDTISIAVLNSSGKPVIECVIETKASTILQFFQGLSGSLQVTFEEGTWAAWLYDLLKPHVTKLVVCNPRRNALLKEGSKSDRIDARKLAELLRSNLLRPVYHAEHGVRTLKELARSYLTINRDLGRVMSRLKAIYRSWGIACAGKQVFIGAIRAALIIAILQTPHRFRTKRQLWTYLIFRRRAAVDALEQRLLDANRTIGQPNKLTLIFGRRITRHHAGKLQTVIEDLNLPNPVIRSHYRKGFLKQYVRDRFLLRTEPATNNIYTDYGIGKAVGNLPQLRHRLDGIIDRYLDVQQDILETFVDREELRQLTQPTLLPNGRRIPGLKLDQPRQLALMHSLVRFCYLAADGTFTTRDLHPQTLQASGEHRKSTSLHLSVMTSGSCAPRD